MKPHTINRYVVLIGLLAMVLAISLPIIHAQEADTSSIEGTREVPVSEMGRRDKALASQNNLKQMESACKMFANKAKGHAWPPISRTRGTLAMQVDAVYPKYLTDPNVLVSPALPDYDGMMTKIKADPKAAFTDNSYWYLGYALPDEETALAFVKAYASLVKSGTIPTDDLKLTEPVGSAGFGKILRLREGIERFFITDISNPEASALMQSATPVIIERPGLHDIGACVLYMDGHTEFVAYPGKFPMTEEFIKALQSLDELKKPQ